MFSRRRFLQSSTLATASTALAWPQVAHAPDRVLHPAGPKPRHIIHMVYAPPWLIPSDRMRNSPEFLERTTPLRRALVGEWTRPEQPFGMGYEKPPFDDR